MDGRVQVDDKGKDVKSENEGDDPLEHGGSILMLSPTTDGKGDEEGQLDEDEDELDPEGESELAVFAVSYWRSARDTLGN